MRTLVLSLATFMAPTQDRVQASKPTQISPSGSAASSPVQTASPNDLSRELLNLNDQENRLKKQIADFEKTQVEAAALNRARMGLGVTLAQKAILELRRDANPSKTFSDSSDLIRLAESYTLAVDTSTLTVDDQRVYADLQAVLRRAITQQVAYLHDRMIRGNSGTITVQQPSSTVSQSYSIESTYYTPVYYQTIPTTCPTVQSSRHHWSLFRRHSGH